MPYLGLILPLAQVEMNHKGLSSQMTGTPRDFEFLYGEWMVQGTRRRAPLDGGEWETIEAVHRCWPVLNGLGNVGELVSDDGEPLYACLRYFDARYARWTLYSVSLADGIAMPPMHGGFAGGVGEFRCEDQVEGRPVVIRDRWTGIGSGRPHWERALSVDGGRRWETCWMMDFERVYWPLETGPAPEWMPAPAHG